MPEHLVMHADRYETEFAQSVDGCLVTMPVGLLPRLKLGSCAMVHHGCSRTDRGSIAPKLVVRPVPFIPMREVSCGDKRQEETAFS